MGVGGAALTAILIAGAASAQAPGDILIGEGVFPESIAATPDGGFVAGSVASPNIYRWSPGEDAASVWATVEGGTTLGVFATAETVYACMINPATFGDGALVTFDASNGAQTGAYPLPNGGLCNDIAIGPDGTPFITDTGAFRGAPGAVLALVADEEGNWGFTTVVAASAIGGADGLAFLGDTLIVNDVITGALWAVELDGATMTGLTPLSLSRELMGPDGMRTAADGSGIYVAENAAGRVSFVTVDGANATVETVGEGEWESATSVAEIGGMVHVIDTKFSMMGNPDAQPGPFYAIAVGGM